ncbi:hypothetical protein HELRODRAFT_68265 [Helobdella robusta]|uniref:Annexin n=1 Tax=Helobdella robusta TaxID=6412 RepID=T1FZC2_HELRO|nr:hypothetical protein HELRODRAFT_68265 [Helobdella robusta]ESN96017.1 hypothetical protein HELRODRAFT_68265 [Helobdella robusta]
MKIVTKAEGTLKAWPNFNSENDCEKLRKAMKGLGTDEKSIIDVLGYRTNIQRMHIVKQFKAMFGKDLAKELTSELSGKFLTCCEALCLPPDVFDASQIKKAVKGLGTDEDVLIEILCTRTNKQIEAMKIAYKQLFKSELEKDIRGDTSGHFRKLLISQLQANRDENLTYDLTSVQDDVTELLRAGQDKWGTDESVFNKIMCQRSQAHLRALFREYSKKSNKNKTVQDAISSEFSGDVKNALLAIVNVIENKVGYFADLLHKSMKGLGTNDDQLIRVVVSRCECDMVQIKKEFERKFNQPLQQWLKDDTSGDYRKILLALIGEPIK